MSTETGWQRLVHLVNGVIDPYRNTWVSCCMCAQAWEEDPLDTLKLMAHLRDVRDGKAEQKAFRLCVKWLYEKHSLTLIENLQEIVEVYTSNAQSYSLYENMSGLCVRLRCVSCLLHAVCWPAFGAAGLALAYSVC